MTRVKGSGVAHKRRKNLLSRAKGFLNGGKSKFRLAKERLLKSERFAYESRRLRKRDFRSMWIVRINGALDQIGSDMNYSTFINLLSKSGSKLNRKSISEMAVQDIESFKTLVADLEKSKK